MATISLAAPEMKTDDEPQLFLANEAIGIGELFYLDTDSKANVADNTDAGKQTIEGVAITAAAANNYVVGATTGTVKFSNTLAVGDVYILAVTGDVKLSSELLTTEYLSVFGTVDTTSSIVIDINNTGSQKA